MTIAKEESINEINLYGDSKLVVDWLNGDRAQRHLGLHSNLQLAEDPKNSFMQIHFHHIHQKHNEEADKLSKQACIRDQGSLIVKSFRDGIEEILPSRSIGI
jgi:ribonuclease HI